MQQPEIPRRHKYQKQTMKTNSYKKSRITKKVELVKQTANRVKDHIRDKVVVLSEDEKLTGHLVGSTYCIWDEGWVKNKS